MARQETQEVTKAKYIIQGQRATTDELFDLAEKLKNQRQFTYARRLLALARKQGTDNPKLEFKVAQRHALCTYKDPDLPAASRLDQALEILKDLGDLTTTQNHETLGLAGAVYKRKWEQDGHKLNLERSLAYYLRGYEINPTADYGYTSINAAFVLDLLADLEASEAQETGGSAELPQERRTKAAEIRRVLKSTLPPLGQQAGNEWLNKEWWFFVTIAEAHFGLDEYDDALVWLRKAKALAGTPDWEYESTARQLATIARLHTRNSGAGLGVKGSDGWRVLEEFLGTDTGGAETAFLGKVGLALSGGGFRASLFHIGVLAKLAELDVLRHVEVLSCVSGGSIIGAHYYLEMRKLLQENKDATITREHYIKIVERVVRDFLAGVQRNLRTRVVANPFINLRMLFSPSYSRSLRIGELFEKEIFSRVPDRQGIKPRWLNDLLVNPADQPQGFAPKHHNWRRKAKVPILILNATTLNTGHNWQFTATWMGEPPASIDESIDSNYRLRRI